MYFHKEKKNLFIENSVLIIKSYSYIFIVYCEYLNLKITVHMFYKNSKCLYIYIDICLLSFVYV